MKKPTTFLAILLCSIAAKAQFAIKVEKDSRKENYQISFTNDNWKHKDQLKENIGHYYTAILFTERSAAIEVAKRFETYQGCLSYNRRVLSQHNNLTMDYRLAFIKP
jgi:hypothetical protein